jgi:hypothetical protein
MPELDLSPDIFRPHMALSDGFSQLGIKYVSRWMVWPALRL